MKISGTGVFMGRPRVLKCGPWILAFVLILSSPFSWDVEISKGKMAPEDDLRSGPQDDVAREGREVLTMAETDQLSEEEGRFLLSVARETIEEKLFGRTRKSEEPKKLPPGFLEKRGTFVTLTEDGNLRGCIGHIVPQEPLIEGIRINALNAAFRDPRFRPLSPQEWARVKIEISILTEPKPLPYSDGEDLLNKLRPGIDGVIIKRGYHQATFLPQVWEQLPKKEEFLAHLCLKAGLDSEAWKKGDLEVLTYQVQAFEE